MPRDLGKELAAEDRPGRVAVRLHLPGQRLRLLDGGLGGDPNSGPPTATAAQIVQTDLASGYKAGYIFTISNCPKVTANGTDRYTGYQINAVPQTVGKTGDRGYCEDQSGIIKQDPAGGTNCTQPIQ